MTVSLIATKRVDRPVWTRPLGVVSCLVFLVRGGVSAILSEKVAVEMVDEVLADDLTLLALCGLPAHIRASFSRIGLRFD